MNVIDIVCILIVLLFVLLGFRRGVIKSAVQLIGTLAVLVLAFQFKDIVANILMKYLPFFNFGGVFQGITTMNILIYEMISFIVIYILLYCILNIVVSISGIIEKLLKLTIVLAIPSKILGALLGLIEGLVMAFLVTFIMLHIVQTEKAVMDSKIAIVILERTPVISTSAISTTKALEEINTTVNAIQHNEDRESTNFKVLHTLIYYGIIDSKDAQTLIDNKKLKFKSTVSF